MIRLAIASDLHAMNRPDGASRQDSFLYVATPQLPPKHDAGYALIELVHEKQLRADVLLVPGDLADQASPQGLVWASHVVDKIAKALKAKSLVTIGNHDVDSHNAGVTDPFQCVKSVRDHFPALDEKSAMTFWTRHYYIAEDDRWRILVLNTAFEHTNRVNAKRGSVAPDTLRAISADMGKRDVRSVQVALMHHHPVIHADIGTTQDDIMLNGDEVLETLAKAGIGLVVHGHKHRARASQVVSLGHHLTILAAGSFSSGLPPKLGSNVRNMFHLIEVDETDRPGFRCPWFCEQPF